MVTHVGVISFSSEGVWLELNLGVGESQPPHGEENVWPWCTEHISSSKTVG